jgi:hypothetical protein
MQVIKFKKISFESAQWAYDNMSPPEFDEDLDPAMDDSELNRTILVERFVTHANAKALDAFGFDHSTEWVARLIDEPEHSWAVEFVADELGWLV